MRLDNQRRSTNIEDRRGGRGGGGGGGGFSGGMPARMRGLPLGVILVGVVIFLLLPANLKTMILSQLGMGGQNVASQGSGTQGACAIEDSHCVFAQQILASTEDTWGPLFSSGRMLNYGGNSSTYQAPVLVLFEGQVNTACGTAPSSVGPFYCPGDNQLYIDPSFYTVMEQRLNAPGDFAQAYVIAHEVAHHVQNLIGATQAGPQEAENQHSVRVELQADCLAGVWGHTAQANLAIDDADLREALNAAHAIGDDTLQRGSAGYVNPAQFTHGTSEQRMRWFRAGFDSGDPARCDTMQQPYARL
jgi:predicted metalloprotease